jgi:hypothetical protein
MKYLSAQPDSFYFLWQIEILIVNLLELKVNAEDIHILVGYNSSIGINPEWHTLSLEYAENASFYFYSDSRESKAYLSSIRPHIIRKHFEKYPDLENDRIFYHDSDIIFRRLPDVSLFEENVWYVSDTRSYTGVEHIKSKGGEDLFKNMCNVIGISQSLVEMNDPNSGGAQYVLNGVKSDFWKKVENDSENLYILICSYLDQVANEAYFSRGVSKNTILGEKLQSWLADMWAILWNSWVIGIKTEITEELSFCLASDSFKEWNAKTILHYTGFITPSTFNKLAFQYFYPYYDDYDYIDSNSASFPLVNLISRVKDIKDEKRIVIEDTSILIPVKIDSESRRDNLNAVLKFINMNFKTNIILHEVDSEQRIDVNALPCNCDYQFELVDDPKMHRTKINNDMIIKAKTPIVVLYDTDIICPPNQLHKAVQLVRQGAVYVSPYDGRMIGVDNSIKKVFLDKAEIGFLEDNKHYFQYTTKRSWGGICVLDKRQYILSGMENENFGSWGPEDIERVKRLRILDKEVLRIEGEVFHLPHDRLLNSGYLNANIFFTYQDEYFRICNMKKEEILDYISTWRKG